jgi:tRNA dimethylallyltransferase
MGPTASGKTEAALHLCRHLPVEVISVDSAQVYRGLDVGTAKPGPETRAECPHALVDIRAPEQPFSAADFVAAARAECEQALARGRLPLLVGGTILYFRALEHGLSPLPAADPAVRAELQAEAERAGWPAMHERLARLDPATAARLAPNDQQRILRALEVQRLTGEPLSRVQRRPGEGGLGADGAGWPLLKLALHVPRAELHARIERRFRAMLEAGLVEEVAALREHGLDPDLPALRAVGYRQVWQYLEGELDWQAMVAAGVAATRQLAKRQITWLRKEPGTHWHDPADLAGIEARVAGFLADRVGP